ncbi:MAG TPA: preprotein translocase subunit YajC [Verrucomicrobiota bacterium]|nr:preprotein translocase subunit YajC [Verrucomicrobiota bacterium]
MGAVFPVHPPHRRLLPDRDPAAAAAGKAHRELLKTLKPGDKVVTSSGLCGTVVSVADARITLRSEDSKLEVLKSAVTEITERKA